MFQLLENRETVCLGGHYVKTWASGRLGVHHITAELIEDMLPSISDPVEQQRWREDAEELRRLNRN